MQGNVLGKSGGGGLDINGIIEEYTVAAGENISAGDFVTFVNETMDNKQLSDGIGSGYTISAVALNENKVFITYIYDGNNYLYGMICTIDNNAIVQENTKKFSYTGSQGYISTVALNENKVFISYANGSSNHLYGFICTIDGTTITQGTNTQLSYNSGVNFGLSAILLSEDKIFITYIYKYNSTSNKKLYGTVYTINGTTITEGTEVEIASSGGSGTKVSAVLLSESKVFIAYGSENGDYLTGIVCTINGTTITKGIETNINSNQSSGSTMVAVALSESKVFIAYTYNNYWYYLRGIICLIDGTTITKGVEIGLTTERISNVSAILLSKNKIFILYNNYNDSYYLYGLTCIIKDTSIVVISNIKLNNLNSNSNIPQPLLLGKAIFVPYGYYSSSHYYLYGMLCNNSIKSIQSSLGQILGITKTNGTEGQTVQVYVPNYEGGN